MIQTYIAQANSAVFVYDITS